MGSLIITIPDIPDANLIYNEDETRLILKFFWPDSAAAIDGLAIDNDARRLAQIALIAGIDGSNAYGYMDALFQALTHRNRDIAQLGRRLARNFVHHWWQHARQRDLEDARIYDAVRLRIALSLKFRLDALKQSVALKRGMTTIALA